MSKKDIKFGKIKLDEIIPYINNQKKHPTEQVEKIMSSIKEFGVINPLIVDKDNVLIAGHGRYEALKRLKYNEVPIIRAEHLTPAQVKAYRIADNKLAELAIWDNELLAIDLSELENIGFDVDILGFNDYELEEILKIDDGFEIEPVDEVKNKDMREYVEYDYSSISFLFKKDKAEEIKEKLKNMTPEEKGEYIYNLIEGDKND